MEPGGITLVESLPSFLRAWGALLALPFLVTLTVSLVTAVIGERHPTWMKRALFGAMAATVVCALATEVPGLAQGTREALVWPVAMGIALLPSLVWLTLARHWRLRWRLAGAVACAAAGSYVGLITLLTLGCALGGSCL